MFTPDLYQSVSWFRNLNATDRHTRTHENLGDIKSLHYVTLPLPATNLYIADVCVRSLASSLEPADQLSCFIPPYD